MNPDVVQIAQLLTVVTAFAFIFGIAGLGVKIVLAREKRRNAQLTSSDMRVDDSRFERLERAVDAIALEVERMSEAQRFTAKLMTERAPERLAPPTDSSSAKS